VVQRAVCECEVVKCELEWDLGFGIKGEIWDQSTKDLKIHACVECCFTSNTKTPDVRNNEAHSFVKYHYYAMLIKIPKAKT
jgi:hypothetical protein